MDGVDAVGCAGVGVVEPHGFGLFFCNFLGEVFSCFTLTLTCLTLALNLGTFVMCADCRFRGSGSGSGVEVGVFVAGIRAIGKVGRRPTTAFTDGFFGLRVAVVAGEEAEGNGVVWGQAVTVQAEADFALCAL